MKTNQKIKAILFFVILFAVLFWFSMPQKSSEPAAKTGSQQAKQANQDQPPEAPLFTLKNLDGEDVSLKDYRGKIVFVNFWATWCGPCRMEIPHLNKLADEYEDGLVILGISVDNPRDYDKIPAFRERYNINYPILLDSQGMVNYLYGGIQSIPTTFVVDRKGRALGKIMGAQSFEQFEKILKKVM